MKISNAVLTSNYNVTCQFKRTPPERVRHLSKDRELDGDKKFHGGSLIAEQIRTPFADSCVACRIKLRTSEVVISAFYNPPHRKCIPEIFDKCIYKALYNHFTFYLSKYQHGFKKHRSFLLNMLSFLKKTHEALDSDPDSEIVAF